MAMHPTWRMELTAWLHRMMEVARCRGGLLGKQVSEPLELDGAKKMKGHSAATKDDAAKRSSAGGGIESLWNSQGFQRYALTLMQASILRLSKT